MSVLIAIDPGQSGGIAILRDTQLSVHPTPATPRDLCEILEQAQRDSYGAAFDGTAPAPLIRCIVERVGGYVGPSYDREGMAGGQPASSAFNFGANYGTILGILTALKIPFELASPQQWIKGLGLGTKGLLKPDIKPGMGKEERKTEIRRVSSINNKLKTAWKNKLKQVGQQLYPHLKLTLKTSDCLLILEWARRRERATEPQWTEKPVALAAQKELAV
jgi:hypothetical protein